MSDRGMLSLYGRFVHVVARVQNTTGPDCFSLRVDPSIGTAPAPYPYPYPRPRPAVASPPHGSGGFAPGFTPWDGGGGGSDGGGGGGGGGGAHQEVVEYVRSQIDGSFALF
ncbi:unnamed protein product [Ectocarpus fasciculatus]